MWMPKPRRATACTAPTIEGQATGTVVNAAPAPAGGFDVLAVAQVESAATQTLHLKAADGAALSLKPLPYALPE